MANLELGALGASVSALASEGDSLARRATRELLVQSAFIRASMNFIIDCAAVFPQPGDPNISFHDSF